MKPIKKSTLLPLVLFVFSTALFVYSIPRNPNVSTLEAVLTIVAQYCIIAALWFVLRRKEKMQRERLDDIENNKHNND